MTEQPAYIRNLRSVTRGDPDGNDIEELEKELYGASDRTTAVMLGSVLETSLERLLATLLRSDLASSDHRKIFDYDGAFGTFSSKIIVAYALKLLGPISRSDLDLIRLLRNEFAHSRRSFTFITPEVKSVCDHLQTPDLPGAYIPHRYLETASGAQLKEVGNKANPKTRYISACHNLAYRMFVARTDPNELPSAQFTDNPLP